MEKPLKNKPMEQLRQGMVHFILSNSYIVFLGAVIFGLIFDIIFGVDLFVGESYIPLSGAGIIVLGSLLIYWAQHTSSCIRKANPKDRTAEDFAQGPYKYSRNPTHIGLTMLTLGLALILNSFFSVIFLIAASLITKFIFLRREEALLEREYGASYCAYKRKVSTWV